MSARTLLFDDLDDSDGATTMVFSVDGTFWSIDLSADHRAEFDSFMARYIKAARPVEGASPVKPGKTPRKPKHSSGASEAADIRAWAKANGMTVNPTGRISSTVVDQYLASRNGSTAAVAG